MARRERYRQPLIELQRTVLSQFKCTTCVADKRFLLCLMFMDYAVEPFYFERDIDFYQDGQSHSFASLLYRAGPVLLGDGALERILLAFQQAMKQKSIRANTQLVEAVQSANWNQLPEALGPLAEASQACLKSIMSPRVSTDAAPVLLLALITRMEVQSTGPYQVRHDRSDNLSRYHDLLLQYINHDHEAEFKHSEIATLRFPLKLREVAQVDSKTSPAVQVADVMAGAAIEAANALAGRSQRGINPDEVLGLYRDDQIIHYLPSIDFEQEKQFRSGTQASAMLDYFSKHFSG